MIVDIPQSFQLPVENVICLILLYIAERSLL